MVDRYVRPDFVKGHACGNQSFYIGESNGIFDEDTMSIVHGYIYRVESSVDLRLPYPQMPKHTLYLQPTPI